MQCLVSGKLWTLKYSGHIKDVAAVAGAIAAVEISIVWIRPAAARSASACKIHTIPVAMRPCVIRAHVDSFCRTALDGKQQPVVRLRSTRLIVRKKSNPGSGNLRIKQTEPAPDITIRRR